MKLSIFKSILLFVAAINMSFILTKPTKNENYVLTVEKGKYVSLGAKEYLWVPVVLTNNTNDTLKYIVMSCPSDNFYRVDSKMLEWGEPIVDCIGNVPRLIKLPPNKSTKTEIKLMVKDGFKGLEVKYRIGFNLKIDDNGSYLMNLINGKQTESIIIWSNVIKMKLRK